jgi:CRISPR-associated protein Csx17
VPDRLRIPGATPATLLGYLIGLGLLRVVARQADPAARACWRDGALELECGFDADTLGAFLLERWVPCPVVSPWNGGSGFFPKDNVAAFDAIEADDGPRLAPFRAAVAAARGALARAGLTEKPEPKVAKSALLRDLRATLPDDALEWLDAAVVLVAGAAAFPAALGSGGNDGRYDIANNYAQAVVFALGLPGASQGAERETALAASLWRAPAVLRKMSLAHLSRDASPVNSPAGESDALASPWDLALAVEGSLLFSAGAVRRLDAGTPPGLAAPFTMHATGAGYGSAVDREKGKAELWLPLWTAPASLPEIEVLFREARAQVGRRAARDGLDAARAAGELGVARGVVAFQRFSILERAGLSNLAVPAGRIEVRERPATLVLGTLEPWLTRVLRHGAGDVPQAQRLAIGRLERASFAVAESGSPAAVRALLEAVGMVERQLAMASERSRPEGLRPVAPTAGPWLEAVDDSVLEIRLATALASVSDSSKLPALRDYLHGTGRDEHGRRYGMPGPGAVPALAGVVERLAAAHARRHQDAVRAGQDLDGTEAHGIPLGFPHAVPSGFADLARFVADDGHDRGLGPLVDGMALLDFTDARRIAHGPVPDAFPDPRLAVLLLAFGGTPRRRRPDWVAQLLAQCQPRPDWVERLRAGQVRGVVSEALLRLQLAGCVPIPTAEDLDRSLATGVGSRLAAALVVHLRADDRRHLVEHLTLATPPPIHTQ